QAVGEVRTRRNTSISVTFERGHNYIRHPTRNVRRHFSQVRQWFVQYPRKGTSLVLSLEQTPMGKRLPEYNASSKHICPPVQVFLTARLLGRHVSDLALELAHPSRRQSSRRSGYA